MRIAAEGAQDGQFARGHVGIMMKDEPPQAGTVGRFKNAAEVSGSDRIPTVRAPPDIDRPHPRAPA